MKGEYQGHERQDKCTPCTVGHKCSTEGLSTPEPCERNHFNNKTSQTVCQPCGVGMASIPGSRSCNTPCTKGQYWKDKSTCERCARKSIAEAAGSLTCKKCPDGEVANAYRTQCVGKNC